MIGNDESFDFTLETPSIRGIKTVKVTTLVPEMFSHMRGNPNMFGFMDRKDFLSFEGATDMISEILHLRQKDGSIYTLIEGLPVPISEDMLRGFVIANFKKITTNEFRKNIWTQMISTCPVLEDFDENVVSFRNGNYDVSKGVIRSSRRFGKIRFDITLTEDHSFPEWEELVTSYWRTDLDKMNKFFSSIFWNKDVIQKRRSILIWDSNGGAGKSGTFTNIQSKMVDDFNWGGLVRDYSRGTMGEMTNISVSPLNIIDDKDNFKIDNGFATDHTKHTFSIKDIGKNKTTITTHATTLILCNGLKDATSGQNFRKRFDYIFSDNIRYDEEERMIDLFDKINADMERLISYLWNWYVSHIDFVIKDKDIIDADTFLAYESDEILELKDRYDTFVFPLEYKGLRFYYDNIKARTPEEKDAIKKWLHADVDNDILLRRKNGTSDQFKRAKETPIEEVEVILEEKQEDTQKGKIAPKDIFTNALLELGAIKTFKKDAKNKYVLADDVLVLDIEPCMKGAAVSETTKSFLIESMQPSLYSETRGGLHMWFKYDTSREYEDVVVEDLKIEVKTKEIFVKDNYIFDGELEYAEEKVPYMLKRKFKNTGGNGKIYDFSEQTSFEIYEVIKDWNCRGKETFKEAVDNYRVIGFERNKTLYRLFGWLKLIGVEETMAASMIENINKGASDPLPQFEIDFLLRRK